MTAEEAQNIYQQAFNLYNKGEYVKAISLFNKLLEFKRRNPLLFESAGLNVYGVRKLRAISLCKSGQYDDAEKELIDLQAVASQFRGNSSQMRYWELVAHYRGDTKKAMDEWLK